MNHRHIHNLGGILRSLAMDAEMLNRMELYSHAKSLYGVIDGIGVDAAMHIEKQQDTIVKLEGKLAELSKKAEGA